ncbi:MAG: CTP synthase [Candidatus Micrarchaeia archaeon]
MPKFLFVTGGVLSSLGKGIFASSLARLLKSRGVNVAQMKIDPYLNCDAGTLNPFEHGEVFVTRDGFECDLDLGNYERFLDVFALREQNLMMGSAYKSVIEKERRGEFLGKTMQVIPHVTNEIKRRVTRAAEVTKCDLLIVEIGGTVGDIESEVVLEAIRQMKFERERGEVLFVHVALLPTVTTGEEKTKPLQHSVKELLSKGISPDFIVARSRNPIARETRDKISLFCNVPAESVFCSPDLANVYGLPVLLEGQGVAEAVAGRMGLMLGAPALGEWKKLVERMDAAEKPLRVAVIGKYATMRDTYASVFEALKHAAAANGARLEAELVDSEKIEAGTATLAGFDAVIVPGGFGERGVEGIIKAIRFAREERVPFLGLCYGMQLAVIEYARNVLGWSDANTTEINPKTTHPVICILPEKEGLKELGGTLRLGAYDVTVEKDTKAFEAYGSEKISKRFRHRYEVNPEHVAALEKAGVRFSGRDPNREIMKLMELREHPFFLATQFHPEFDSRLGAPEPLFNALAKAALTNKK